LPPCIALLPLALLAGCAHQVKPDSAAKAMPVPVIPMAAPPRKPGAYSGRYERVQRRWRLEPMGGWRPGVGSDRCDRLDSANLPGPPADSVVTLKQADLFERLRGGFALD
jgi:hypothetical protein